MPLQGKDRVFSQTEGVALGYSFSAFQAEEGEFKCARARTAGNSLTLWLSAIVPVDVPNRWPGENTA